jgi:hypothetical protein
VSPRLFLPRVGITSFALFRSPILLICDASMTVICWFYSRRPGSRIASFERHICNETEPKDFADFAQLVRLGE